MALGEASVQITPDLSAFMAELQKGVTQSMGRVEAIVENATEGMEESFREVSAAVQRELDGIYRDANGRLRDVQGRFVKMSNLSREAIEAISKGDAFAGIESDAKRAAAGVEKSFKKAANDSESAFRGVGSGFGKVAAGLGAALAGVGLTQFLSGAALDAQAANSALANTAQLIESTGGKAGVTQAQIESLSNALMLEIGIDDTAVIEASNVLLTFTQVSGPIFDETIARAADLSSVFGTDLQGATMQLGKALNDPVRGLTALSRSGVSFTAEQKAMIKEMVAAGDTAAAQRLILDELAVQFGGTAAASADSTAKISAAMGEVKESIGQGLIGAIDALSPVLVSTFQSLEKPLAKVGESLGDALATVIEAVGPVLPVLADALGSVLTNLGRVFEAMAPAIEPLANILSTIANVVGKVLAKAFEAIAPVVIGFVEAVSVIVDTVGPVILDIFRQLAPVIRQVAQALSGQLAAVLPIIVQLIRDMAPIFGQIVGVIAQLATTVLSTLLPPLTELVTTVLAALAPVLPEIATAFLQIVEALMPLIPPLLEIVVVLLPPLTDLLVAIIPLLGVVADLFASGLAAAIRLVTPVLLAVADALAQVATWIGQVIDWVSKIITSFTNWLRNWRDTLTNIKAAVVQALPGILQWFKDLPGKILTAIGNLGQTLFGKAKDLVGGLLTGIQNAWQSVRDWLGDLAGKVLRAVGNVAKTLYEKGRDVIIGLWDGMKRIWETVTGWLGSFGERILRGLGNIGNVLFDIGKKIIDGLWQGMKATWNSVSSWLGGLGGWIVDLKGPPKKDATLLFDNGRLIMKGLQDGMESGFKGIRSFLRNATMEIAGSVGPMGSATIPMPGLTSPMPSALSPEEADKIFADLEMAERQLTLGTINLSDYEQILLDSIGKFEVYSDEYMQIYSLLSRTQQDLASQEEQRASAELERIANRYEATGKGADRYLASLREQQSQYTKWSSEWMAIQSEINSLRKNSVDAMFAEAEAARDVADAVETQTEARREYKETREADSEATDEERKRAGMAYAQSIYELLQAKAAKKGIPDRSVRWARFMRKRLQTAVDAMQKDGFTHVVDGLKRIMLGIPNIEPIEKDESGDPAPSSPAVNVPIPPRTPSATAGTSPYLNEGIFGRMSESALIQIQNATFNNATDADLVAQRLTAALAIRSMS